MSEGRERLVQEAFRRLEEIAPSLDLDVVEVEGEDKYVDREYALRKIGLRRGVSEESYI